MNYGVKVTASFLLISLPIFSHAGYLDDWTDDQICGWMDNPSPPEHMVEEAVKRNLDCAPESAKKKAQVDTGLQIMIYDADFSDSDLDKQSQSSDFGFDNNPTFSEDFENGENVTDWSNKWFITKEKDGNSIYCNKPDDDWTGFHFGNNNWSNYSMSLRMIFPIQKKSFAEVYIRINSASEGYSLYISNYYPVTYLKVRSPEERLGNGNVPVKRNEWFQIKLIFSGNNLKFFHDGKFIEEIIDDKKANGLAGVGSRTFVCVDDIKVNPI